MADLLLSASDVAAVRRVLMVEHPVYETRMRTLLQALHRLIPSDCLGFGLGDAHGFLEMQVNLPEHVYGDLGPHVCDGPLHTGVEQLAVSPYAREELPGLAALGVRDCLRIGFPLGGGRVAQLFFDRRRRYFGPRDVQVLGMLQPALARLVQPPDQASHLAMLSGSERQVLDLVSRGASNQDVADQLSISEATVRKHLEHVYRKLGVTNRTAASALARAAAPA
jgi:DNA-binding CsgD family transcriptional regulator